MDECIRAPRQDKSLWSLPPNSNEQARDPLPYPATTKARDEARTGQLGLDQITADPQVSARVLLDDKRIKKYAEAITGGANFLPVVVYHDGAQYWLAEGFLRLAAAKQAGLPSFAAQILPGDRRDAILRAVKANDSHGQERTNADKRRAVRLLLDDPEWGQWSDRGIARLAGVSDKTVAALRPQCGNSEVSTRVYRTKHGTPGKFVVKRRQKRCDIETASATDDHVPKLGHNLTCSYSADPQRSEPPSSYGIATADVMITAPLIRKLVKSLDEAISAGPDRLRNLASLKELGTLRQKLIALTETVDLLVCQQR